MLRAAPTRAKENTISAIKARSRKPAGVLTSRLSSSCRTSLGSSTGVLPLRAVWLGPRTDAAGLCGTTCPTTSQSNKCRIAASRCLTDGAAKVWLCSSIQVATCNGATAARSATPMV
ncbi:hypothetical protein D3C84_868990 [compost metagenome]